MSSGLRQMFCFHTLKIIEIQISLRIHSEGYFSQNSYMKLLTFNFWHLGDNDLQKKILLPSSQSCSENQMSEWITKQKEKK